MCFLSGWFIANIRVLRQYFFFLSGVNVKRIVIASVVIVLGSVALLVAPLFIHWEGYKQAILISVKAATGREVIINGKITGSFLPLPSINVSDIFIANKQGSSADDVVKARTMKLRLSLFKLLQGKVGVVAVSLQDATIELERFDNGKLNWSIGGQADSRKGASYAIPNKIELINTTVTLRKNSSQFLHTFKNVNAIMGMHSVQGPFHIAGDLVHDKKKIAFTAAIGELSENKQTKVSSEIVEDNMRIAFDGELTQQEKGNTLIGKLDVNINNLKDELHTRGGFFRFLSIGKKESTTVTGDVKYANREVMLDNMVVSSANIKGKGQITFSFEATPVIDVAVNFDMINLDELRQGELRKKKIGSYEYNVIRKSSSRYFAVDMPKNINFLLYLTANKVVYNSQPVENIVINADLFNGGIEVYPSTAQLPGNNKVEVSGSISSNKIRPVFEGSAVVKGQDLPVLMRWLNIYPGFMDGDVPAKLAKFDIKTALSLTPREIRFTNIDAFLAGANVGGSFFIRHGNGLPEANANLSISTLNMDNPFFAAWRQRLLQPFTSPNDDVVGADFQWLRKMSTKVGAELTVGELRYNGRIFKQPLFVFHILPGSLECDKFAVSSEMANVEGDVLLDIRALRPKIAINIKGETLDTAVFSFPKTGQEKEGAVLPPVIAGVEAVPQPAVGGNSKWSETPFNFPRFDKFSGAIHADVNKFVHGGVAVNRLIFSSRLSDGALLIDNLKGEIFNGRLLAKGAVGAIPPSLSLSFSLSNGVLAPFLQTFSEIDTLSGYFSLSGSFTTQGNSPAMWASALEAGVSMAVRDMTMKNFDLHSLVVSAASKEVVSEAEFSNIVSSVFNKGEVLFNNIDGNFSVDKGMLQVSGLNFGTARTQGVLSGSIDVKNWLLNMASQIAFIPTEGANPLSIGVTMTGAVENPEKKIDVAAVKNYVMSKGPSLAPQVETVEQPDEWGNISSGDKAPNGTIPESAVSVVPGQVPANKAVGVR